MTNIETLMAELKNRNVPFEVNTYRPYGVAGVNNDQIITQVVVTGVERYRNVIEILSNKDDSFKVTVKGERTRKYDMPLEQIVNKAVKYYADAQKELANRAAYQAEMDADNERHEAAIRQDLNGRYTFRHHGLGGGTLRVAGEQISFYPVWKSVPEDVYVRHYDREVDHYEVAFMGRKINIVDLHLIEDFVKTLGEAV